MLAFRSVVSVLLRALGDSSLRPLNTLPGIAPVELVIARTDELLRFGVQFADGRKATNLDRPSYDPDREPDRPVLNQHGGGGGGLAWDMGHWVWPLPPPGPFTFVCEWPARGIAESRAEIDAGSILEAAGRAVTFWPDE
jgi:hypothetical protein